MYTNETHTFSWGDQKEAPAATAVGALDTASDSCIQTTGFENTKLKC